MIAFRNVTLEITGRQVLRDVSFELPHQTLACFVGTAAAGKTQLLSAILGLAPISSGQVLVNEFDVVKQPLPARKLVCLVPALAPLPTDLSVIEALRFLVWLGTVRAPSMPETVRALRRADVPDVLMSQRCSQLTQFQRLCVWLAGFHLRQAAVLAVDEPASDLNMRQRERLSRLLRRAVEPNHQVVVATRDEAFARRLADRMYWLEDGVVDPERTTDVQPMWPEFRS